ncbi:winged helix-turn-helix transcriptional regulator [Halomicrobium sp. IBSBa]|uniref:winged helix-turn-helix transcriptional regulator n=1 Tax=Halomicrobium sp. IBSBa TaxID=2778916 RepID=UPI001ABFF8D1|nr:winged helix-turn-helix transcriptional regulator [Halomicrobium sp. IBSBa]MBO4247462.1 winged helix-turn-helix transcriptional regulator [Halomicrobium sp. IBSBa]
MGLDRLAEQVEKERRDLQILEAVIEHGPIGIASLAEVAEIPEHKVRYSLRMLENDELVQPTPEGAVPADDIEARIATMNQGLERLHDRTETLKAIFDEE